MNSDSLKEQNNKKRLSFLTIFLILIIIGLSSYIVYDKVLSKPNSTEANNNQNNNNSKDDKDDSNAVIDPYKEYSDFNWVKTKKIENAVNIAVGIDSSGLVNINNGEEVKGIIGKAKYITYSPSCQDGSAFHDITVLTEEGNVYYIPTATDYPAYNLEFQKVQTDEKIIELYLYRKGYDENVCHIDKVYGLTESGSLKEIVWEWTDKTYSSKRIYLGEKFSE